MRFQLKFTLALTGAILVGLTLFGVFAVHWSEDKVIETELERGRHNTETVVLVIRVIDTILQRQADVIASDDGLAALLAGGADDLDAMDPLLVEAIDGDQIVASATVVDRTGRIVASTDPDLIGTAAADAPTSFGRLPDLAGLAEPEGQFLLDDVELSMVAFAPIVDDGRTIGVVQVAFEPALIGAALEDQRFGETGQVLFGVRDPDGTMRSIGLGADGVEITRLPAASDRPMVAALNGESIDADAVVIEEGDEPAVVVARPAPEIGVAVVSRIERAEVVAQVADIRNALLLVGAALTGAAIVAGFILSRRMAVQLAEQERAEAKFTSMFTSAPMAMLAVGADGRINLANDRAAGLLGYEVEQLQAMRIEAVVPAAPEFIAASDARVVCSGRDLVAVASDGGEIPVEMSLTPLDPGDRPLVIAALVDLTFRKRAEQLLSDHAEDLARSNRDLDDFAYVAAHDLKSPLRAMSGLATMVLEDSADALSEQSRNDLIQICDRSNALTDMLSGLLQYARIGQALGQPAEVDPREVLTELVPVYVPTDRFVVDVDDDLPAVFAPRPAVELVLRNLLMNSVEHHDQVSGRIGLAATVEPGWVKLTFTDDGPGIPQESERKAFQLFGTLKHEDKGQRSGLGLAVIKRTIESSGGSIALIPREGRGTAFEMRWPAVGRGTGHRSEPEARTASRGPVAVG